MSPNQSKKRRVAFAFSAIDLVVVIATIAILGIIVLPALALSRESTRQIQCLDNLKRISLGFRSWMLDHNYKVPWDVPRSEGGAKAPPAWETNGQVTRARFFVCSNEMETPKILTCPSETAVAPFEDWASCASGTNSSGVVSNAPLSYFLMTGVEWHYPTLIFGGDENLESTGDNLGDITFGYLAGMMPPSTAYWNSTTMHRSAGNVFLADGSVQKTTDDSIRKVLMQGLDELGGSNSMSIVTKIVVNKP